MLNLQYHESHVLRATSKRTEPHNIALSSAHEGEREILSVLILLISQEFLCHKPGRRKDATAQPAVPEGMTNV